MEPFPASVSFTFSEDLRGLFDSWRSKQPVELSTAEMCFIFLTAGHSLLEHRVFSESALRTLQELVSSVEGPAE